ncbi:MAG: SCO1664 family protein [Nocardioides sp.]
MIPDRDEWGLTGPVELEGRIMPASNATFLGRIDGIRVVYKPIAGERPLWDFPDGRLAWRELAAWRVSDALGWNVVPFTTLGEGPHGNGMVQVWMEPDPEQNPVDVVPTDRVPEGYRHVFDGLDSDERPVALIHEDSGPLRRMAIFDVLINNGDRKGGHVLAMPDGHRYGVDHGVSFHSDDKLRTVLWGWQDTDLTEEECRDLRKLRGSAEQVADALSGLVTETEVARFFERLDRLLRRGRLPRPSDGWPAIPWPPF